MSYSLTLSNGNYVPGIGSTGLQDGTVDAGSTSLSLVGKNYPGYGKLLNENFVYLLENFANSASPAAALPGQLWWNSTEKVLKVNTATTAGDTAIWKSLTSIYNAAPITDSTLGTVGTPKSIPYAPNVGDLWWDTANRQLKLYSAVLTEGFGGWITIGPVNNTTTGQSGATPDTILDNVGISHVVVKFYISNALVAILSKEEEFTPGTFIPGFTSVKPGFTLSEDPALPKLEYFKTANVAMNLMVGNTIVSADSFARNDVVTTSNVGLSTASNDGMTIGSLGDFKIDVENSTGNGRIYHTVTGKNVVISVNQLGVITPVFVANGTSGSAEVINSPTTPNGVANKYYVDQNALMRDGSSSLTGALVPVANAAINIGSTSSWFGTMYASGFTGTTFNGLNYTGSTYTGTTYTGTTYNGTTYNGTTFNGTTFTGTAMTAKYADLAERFAADAEYDAGTVVELGGTAEITSVKADLSDSVFGVISTKAAYLMNGSSGDDTTHPPVALSGRVPVKVTGVVKKGDRLVSAGNGIARAGTKEEITAWNVIGRALADKTTDGKGTIEAIVTINN